ncbi:MAG: signal peptidase II [bacterium]
MTPRHTFAWAAILGLFLDQLTKLLVQGAHMTGPPENWTSVRLLGEYLFISPARNPHGLFSWRYGPRFVYFILPLVGVGLVVWFALRNRDRWAGAAYGMILAGALGNLIDRARVGWVIDFIDFRLPQLGFRWFTFNLADALLVVGIGVLLARELFGRRAAGSLTQPGSAGDSVTPAATDSETGLPRQ